MIKCDVCGKELTKEVSSFFFDCGGTCLTCMAELGDPECVKRYVALEDKHTTLHGIKQNDIDWLITWYEDYTARYTPNGWVVGDTTWIEILRNSARQ